MDFSLRRAAALMVFFGLAAQATADSPEKYALRYQFRPGETVRWEVEHRSNVRTTISKTTQTAETLSLSVKKWQVKDVKPDGSATFEHGVESVDMRQELTGRNEVRYNSRTDAKAPVGFEDVAKSVGVPLLRVTIDAHGKLLHREHLAGKQSAKAEGWMTIPLPEEPVAVGHTWSLPQTIDIPLESGGVKRVKSVQQFTLESVQTGVAVIRVSTDVLTPITDPAVESQLVQREAAGLVRFDIDAGRVLSQQLDIDKHVVGFRGEASSIHYINRFSERLLNDPIKTAGKDEARD
ncbi:MAG: hypothetical protein ABFC77_07200 [Thermoguttaceae bacterium]